MYVVPLPARLEKNKKNSNVSLITSLYKYNKCVLEGFVYTAIFDPSSFMQTFFLLYNLYLIFLHLSHSCDYTVRPRTYLYLSYAHTHIHIYIQVHPLTAPITRRNAHLVNDKRGIIRNGHCDHSKLLLNKRWIHSENFNLIHCLYI